MTSVASPMRHAFQACLVLLTVIGIFVASQRLYIVHDRLTGPAEQRYAATALEIRNVEILSIINGATPGTARRVKFDAFVNRLGSRWTQPWYAVIHLVPGILMFILMPIQLSRRVRARWIQYHRWSGRTILFLGVGIVVSSVWYGIVNPQVAVIEAPTIAVFTTLFVLFASRGYAAIRRKDTSAHREWMIRLYAVTLAIGTVRLVSVPLAYTFRDGDPGVMLITSFWIGWLLTLGAGEWWIRRTRSATVRLTTAQ